MLLGYLGNVGTHLAIAFAIDVLRAHLMILLATVGH